jgi:hypothetical protein
VVVRGFLAQVVVVAVGIEVVGGGRASGGVLGMVEEEEEGTGVFSTTRNPQTS